MVKRTAHAAVKIAVDMVREGLINERDALKELISKFRSIVHPTLDQKRKLKLFPKAFQPLGRGLRYCSIFFCWKLKKSGSWR